jgi:hypothetical protein
VAFRHLDADFPCSGTQIAARPIDPCGSSRSAFSRFGLDDTSGGDEISGDGESEGEVEGEVDGDGEEDGRRLAQWASTLLSRPAARISGRKVGSARACARRNSLISAYLRHRSVIDNGLPVGEGEPDGTVPLAEGVSGATGIGDPEVRGADVTDRDARSCCPSPISGDPWSGASEDAGGTVWTSGTGTRPVAIAAAAVPITVMARAAKAILANGRRYTARPAAGT